MVLSAHTPDALNAFRGLMPMGSSSIVTNVGCVASLAQSNAAASAASPPTAPPNVRKSTGMLLCLLQVQHVCVQPGLRTAHPDQTDGWFALSSCTVYGFMFLLCTHFDMLHGKALYSQMV